MRNFKSRIMGFLLLLVLCVLCKIGVQAKGEPIDYDLGRQNESFYAALTDLLASQDTSNYFGAIQIKIGEAKLFKDGEEQILDAAPEIINDRTMLPIRAVAEAAGMNVDWDSETNTIIISDAYGDRVTASIGSDTITVNGEARKMDVTPYIRNNRSFCPVRAISEALNLDVAWDGATNTVTITAPYQTARLLVMTSDDLSSKVENAVTMLYDGSGMWVLQFSTPSEAKEAANVLRCEDAGYEPEPDIYALTGSADYTNMRKTENVN